MVRVHAGVQNAERRVKFVSDIDCLPTDVNYVAGFDLYPEINDEVFNEFYGFAKFLEKLGFDACVDFGGDWYYETGVPVIDANYKGRR